MALQRAIGIAGLTLVGVGGVVGSGWLFAPLLAAREAGPASILSWAIAGVAIFVIALTFAEVCARLPVAGGLGRLPFFTHGRLTAAAMGWTAWLGYVATSTIEVSVMLGYLAQLLPWLDDGAGALTLWGKLAGVAMLALLTVLNAVGVGFLVRVNAGLTWLKVGLPLIVAVLIAADRFVPGNFTAHGGFMAQGWDGTLGAITTGGVVFAFLGFRHVIDMAGEARRPQVTVPVALGFTILLCLLLYGALQVAFIGALDERMLAGGWGKLSFGHALGPLGAMAVALGMVWLSWVVLAGAVVSPFGAALVTTGSNARLGLALARNGFFPKAVMRLSPRHVPFNAMLLNLVLSAAMLLLLPFHEIVALVGAVLTFSLVTGPLSLLALRRQEREPWSGFRLPFAVPLCALAFVLATLIVYWSGWNTVWRFGVALAIGAALFAVMSRRLGLTDLHGRQALWLVPYLLGIGLLSWLGNFGGGQGVIPEGWDMIAGAALGLTGLALGVRLRLGDADAAKHRSEVDGFEGELGT